MNKPIDLKKDIEELSEPVTIGVEAYISEEYARAERDKGSEREAEQTRSHGGLLHFAAHVIGVAWIS